MRSPPSVVRRFGVTSLLVTLVCRVALCQADAEAAPVVTETGAMRYLSQFGYLPPVNPASGGIISEETMSKAISEFQSFAGINITGNLDGETAHLMSLPRCGVKDKVGPSTDGRSKRYALQGRTDEELSTSSNPDAASSVARSHIVSGSLTWPIIAALAVVLIVCLGGAS